MGEYALISWIATAGVGFSLVGVFFGRGGMSQLRRGRRRLRPQLVLSHIGLALAGLAAWIAYLATDELAIGWAALALLLVVTVLGLVSFYVWQRRRIGLLRATESSWDLPRRALASEDIPAEQHFPVSVVVMHGLFALATIVLVMVGVLSAANDERSRTASSPAASGLAPPGGPRSEEAPRAALPLDPPSPARPRGVRLVRRGPEAVVTFRARASRTDLSQLARRDSGRSLRTRRAASRPGRRERVRLRVARGARFVTLASVGADGNRSRSVLVRLP